MPLIPKLKTEQDGLAHVRKTLSRMEAGEVGAKPRTYDTFGQAQTLPELVDHIIQLVQREGDQGVSHCLNVIDNVNIQPDTLVVSQKECEKARGEVSQDLENALQLMAKRIRVYAEKMMPKMESWFEEEPGHKCGWRFTPIDNLGAYVPGGLGGSTPLISTVMMNLIPAKVAGVKNIVVATPCSKGGAVNAALLRACEIAGATTIYRAGGAQGVAAMALGTASCPPCSKIIGPGNAFVQEAKRQLFGKIDIDMMAGPSEIAIIADEHADPSVVAADLIAQAEHDALASSTLFTTSESLIDAVQTEVAVQLETLPKRDIAEASLRDFGALCWCESLDQAAKMSDALAPEHLQLSVQSPEALLPKLQHAGAIFMGYSTAEVAGDYTAGPSHTLPTCGAARFTSGINVFTFLKSSSLLHYSSSAMEEDLHALTTMAREENLEGHARSAESRFKTTT